MAFTNAGGKFFICTTPQPTDLDQAQFEALDWTEVSNVGSLPTSGTTTNMVSYDTIDTDVSQNAKGISSGGGGPLEVARIDGDPGQIALRAAALTRFNYATKRELTDAPDADHTNSAFYNRGLISGPEHAGGRNEDFVLETFTFANNQREIVVGPQSLIAPANTLVPAIAGTAQVGQTLTALPGNWTGEPTFSYQWKKAGANISGATGVTYMPVIGEIASALSVAVTGTNPAGNATATSGATANVIAA